jgi:ribosomal protein S18 acetylase RimI-like enzyme
LNKESKILYRLATEIDLDNLVKLGLDSYGQFSETLTLENWEKLNRSLRDKKTLLDLINLSSPFVAVDNKDIVGMIYLVPSGNPNDIYENDWCYIRRLGVHPAYNGFGIGRELIQLCIKEAQKNGEKVLALHTSEFMNAARHIYESMGFKQLKEIAPVFGKRYWLYIMELG